MRRCGNDGEPLSPEDARVVRLFAKFLQDPAGRCAVCHHKLKRHGREGCTRCLRRGETCPIPILT